MSGPKATVLAPSLEAEKAPQSSGRVILHWTARLVQVRPAQGKKPTAQLGHGAPNQPVESALRTSSRKICWQGQPSGQDYSVMPGLRSVMGRY